VNPEAGVKPRPPAPPRENHSPAEQMTQAPADANFRLTAKKTPLVSPPTLIKTS